MSGPSAASGGRAGDVLRRMSRPTTTARTAVPDPRHVIEQQAHAVADLVDAEDLVEDDPVEELEGSEWTAAVTFASGTVAVELTEGRDS